MTLYVKLQRAAELPEVKIFEILSGLCSDSNWPDFECYRIIQYLILNASLETMIFVLKVVSKLAIY